jgi:hypothetical protein
MQAAMTNGKSSHLRGSAIVSMTRKDVTASVSGFTSKSYMFRALFTAVNLGEKILLFTATACTTFRRFAHGLMYYLNLQPAVGCGHG